MDMKKAETSPDTSDPNPIASPPENGPPALLELHKHAPVPSTADIGHLIELLFALLYPGYFGSTDGTEPRSAISKNLEDASQLLTEQIYRAVRLSCQQERECDHCRVFTRATAQNFWRAFPEIKRLLEMDVQAAFDGDPAAKGLEEIILAYPGFEAITVYRLAHELHKQGIALLPRMMTEHAHRRTGIDIHPGAKIGERFFIDHGTGVVIGETTTIGRNVKMYQGVTLGALSFRKDERGQIIREGKRHPTIEDDVVIYAGATILGGKTTIGKGSVIGGNTWLTHSIPPGSIVINEPQEQRIHSPKE